MIRIYYNQEELKNDLLHGTTNIVLFLNNEA